MPSNRQVTVGLSDMAPNVVILPPINIDKSRNFAIRPPPTRDRSRNFMAGAAVRPPPTRDRRINFAIAPTLRPPPTRDRRRNVPISTALRPDSRDEVSVDLISMTSDDNPEDKDDDDQISFDEGRLQEWNLAEFQMQVLGSVSGMVLIFGCGLISTWAIADFIKDFEKNEAEWTDSDYHEDFWASRHVIIAMVVLSYNVGCIVGAILGAFITPLLPNRLIYILGSVLMLFTGILLTMHTSAFFCARSRLVAGLVCGLVQVTLLVQAAESTTKKVRRWMLIVVAYINALSSFASTIIFHNYDGRDQVTYTEHNTALIIISYLMCGCALAALILNFLFTKDTIPFLLVRGEEIIAFEEISRLKSDHLSIPDIRCEYDRIRFDVTQSQTSANRNLAARSNQKPLISMCFTRIINLVFSSVAITLASIWSSNYDVDYDNDGTDDVISTESQEISNDDDDVVLSPLFVLAICQGFRLFCSLALIIRKEKYYFNRTCYKLAALNGATMILSGTIYMVFDVETIDDDSILMWIFVILFLPLFIIIAIGFFALPVPLDIIQLNQSADSYTHIKNIWSLAFGIFIENFVQIFLIIQLDLIFGVFMVDILSGMTLLYCSHWLLRNMPNIAAIYPCTVAIIAQATNSHNDVNSIHI